MDYGDVVNVCCRVAVASILFDMTTLWRLRWSELDTAKQQQQNFSFSSNCCFEEEKKNPWAVKQKWTFQFKFFVIFQHFIGSDFVSTDVYSYIFIL